GSGGAGRVVNVGKAWLDRRGARGALIWLPDSPPHPRALQAPPPHTSPLPPLLRTEHSFPKNPITESTLRGRDKSGPYFLYTSSAAASAAPTSGWKPQRGNTCSSAARTVSICLRHEL